jgi:tetratricopeptide (TPR) repeat protein
MILEQDLYTQAMAAFKANDMVKARELLSQLLKIDRKNIEYWLWMSAAVETPKERIYCLREVLILDPENEEAALGLRMLGENAPDPQPVPRSDPLVIPWKTQIEIEDENPAGQRALRSKIALFSILGLIIIAVFGFGIYLALRPSQSANTATVKRWTVTPLPTATETLPATITPTGTIGLSIVLDSTFTPTAIYVATPHNRLEAYTAGMRAYEKKDWTNAVTYFNQVLTAEPQDADVYYHLGDVYRFEGDYASALSAYQKSIEINANFAPGYLGEAQVDLYGPKVNTDAALAALQKAVTLDPNLNQAYLELANVSLAQNDPDSAMTWLDKLNDSMPNNAQVELIRAQTYMAQGNLDQALTTIQKARADDRSVLKIYLVWTQILQAQGEYNASLVPLLTYVNNAPASLGSKILLARAYYMIGDTDQALTLVNDCLAQDDKFTDAHLLRGDINLSQSKVEDARTDFNAILRYDYNNFDANIGIGRVMLANTMAGSAYNQFDYCGGLAKTDAQQAVMLYWRAASLQALDENTAAVRDYQAALAFPLGVLPDQLHQDAEKQLSALVTPTPSQTPTKTVEASATPTVTPTPRITSAATLKPSVTPTKK